MTYGGYSFQLVIGEHLWCLSSPLQFVVTMFSARYCENNTCVDFVWPGGMRTMNAVFCLVMSTHL